MLLKGDDDGMAARFLWVWPNKVPPRRPQSIADSASALEAFHRLAGLEMASDDRGEPQPQCLPLSAAAVDLLQEWRDEQYLKGDCSGMVGSARGKAPGQLLRLALVLEHLWWSGDPSATEPREVGEAAIGAAAHLMEAYFTPMAGRVYGDAAVPEGERLAGILCPVDGRESPHDNQRARPTASSAPARLARSGQGSSGD